MCRHSMWRQGCGDASARVHSARRWLLVCAGVPACLGPLLAAQDTHDILFPRVPHEAPGGTEKVTVVKYLCWAVGTTQRPTGALVCLKRAAGVTQEAY